MKIWLTQVSSLTAVGLAFITVAHIGPSGWRFLGLVGAIMLLQFLFVPRYPRSELLREAFKVRKGQKIEVEGR